MNLLKGSRFGLVLLSLALFGAARAQTNFADLLQGNSEYTATDVDPDTGAVLAGWDTTAGGGFVDDGLSPTGGSAYAFDDPGGTIEQTLTGVAAGTYKWVFYYGYQINTISFTSALSEVKVNGASGFTAPGDETTSYKYVTVESDPANDIFWYEYDATIKVKSNDTTLNVTVSAPNPYDGHYYFAQPVPEPFTLLLSLGGAALGARKIATRKRLA